MTWLERALPASGQPYLNLRRIAIKAQTMEASFPAQLPNLEHLIIRSHCLLAPELENPLAIASVLTSFQVLGEPLVLKAVDVLRMSSSLAGRSLTLDAEVDDDDGDKSCIYLRHNDANQLAMEELYKVVWSLVYDCTCGACLDFLSRAGCLPV